MAAFATWGGFLSQLDFQRHGSQSVLSIIAEDRGDAGAKEQHERDAKIYVERGNGRRKLASVFGAASLIAFVLGVAFCVNAFIA
jgi:hypothetical protein